MGFLKFLFIKKYRKDYSIKLVERINFEEQSIINTYNNLYIESNNKNVEIKAS
ncbi:hypothetical protein [Clostridium folliculivorans]|uniref:Uncharacterized protein n=1 Tax=Clostridium folliculivorans TaxID=2886038 RepID=A0A9W5Y0N3_9CLOT|nr:hypothetical protein [Clostridium folliculivorans]GKU24564.1 hypothetical protein CFOLD11_13900 [Clostridium folliculivorans]GKU30662.1 hypothetical protein CFB3_27690 [Clostridium folliculivorans]